MAGRPYTLATGFDPNQFEIAGHDFTETPQQRMMREYQMANGNEAGPMNNGLQMVRAPDGNMYQRRPDGRGGFVYDSPFSEGSKTQYFQDPADGAWKQRDIQEESGGLIKGTLKTVTDDKRFMGFLGVAGAGMAGAYATGAGGAAGAAGGGAAPISAASPSWTAGSGLIGGGGATAAELTAAEAAMAAGGAGAGGTGITAGGALKAGTAATSLGGMGGGGGGGGGAYTTSNQAGANGTAMNIPVDGIQPASSWWESLFGGSGAGGLLGMSNGSAQLLGGLISGVGNAYLQSQQGDAAERLADKRMDQERELMRERMANEMTMYDKKLGHESALLDKRFAVEEQARQSERAWRARNFGEGQAAVVRWQG